jgi:hypothetical protein
LPEVSTSETATGLPGQVYGRLFNQLFKLPDLAADLPVRRSYVPIDISRDSAARSFEHFDDPCANNFDVPRHDCRFGHLSSSFPCRGN